MTRYNHVVRKDSYERFIARSPFVLRSVCEFQELATVMVSFHAAHSKNSTKKQDDERFNFERPRATGAGMGQFGPKPQTKTDADWKVHFQMSTYCSIHELHAKKM